MELVSVPFAALDPHHRGTGSHTYTDTVVEVGSVTDRMAEPLFFQRPEMRVTTMLFQLQAGNTVGVTMEPKWYGVSYRSDISPSAFNAITVFFHPSPGNAGMQDSEYQTLGGKWSGLYRYMQNLGCQLSAASSDIVVVMPMFSNRTYGTMGVFGGAWQEILGQLLAKAQDHRISAANAAAPKPLPGGQQQHGIYKTARLRHVILSGFSRGRAPMTIFRSKAKGLEPLLRGVWDFDGVGAGLPAQKSGMRVLAYDSEAGSGKRGYPLPVPRWRLHPLASAIKNGSDVHGFIPATMLTHAASQPEFRFQP